MKITGRNIAMIRGDSEAIVISCTNIDGSVLDFVDGDKVYMTVKESVHTAEKVFQKLVTEFTEGKAIVEINPEETKNLPYGTYVYDVQFVRFDGKVTTIIPPSEFNIIGEVTYE